MIKNIVIFKTKILKVVQGKQMIFQLIPNQKVQKMLKLEFKGRQNKEIIHQKTH